MEALMADDERVAEAVDARRAAQVADTIAAGTEG